MKDPLVRFSVAIGGELLQKFDHYRETHRYPNRSEAVRGLMRAALIEEAVADDDERRHGGRHPDLRPSRRPDLRAADRAPAPPPRTGSSRPPTSTSTPAAASR